MFCWLHRWCTLGHGRLWPIQFWPIHFWSKLVFSVLAILGQSFWAFLANPFLANLCCVCCVCVRFCFRGCCGGVVVLWCCGGVQDFRGCVCSLGPRTPPPRTALHRTAQNFAHFSSPATIFFLSSLSWEVLSWNFGDVFEGLGCRVNHHRPRTPNVHISGPSWPKSNWPKSNCRSRASPPTDRPASKSMSR